MHTIQIYLYICTNKTAKQNCFTILIYKNRKKPREMKVNLTTQAVKLLKNSKNLEEISVKTDIRYATLYRWVKTLHENLTLYKVLCALSQITGIEIDKLVTVTK